MSTVSQKTSLATVMGAGGLCLSLSLLAGCGKVSARNFKVDESLARESLQAFLEAWKSGSQVASLKERSVAIHGMDEDWQRGVKLADFRLLSDEFNDGANLHIKAQLLLVEKRNRKRKATVTYIVGTSPLVTVFRE